MFIPVAGSFLVTVKLSALLSSSQITALDRRFINHQDLSITGTVFFSTREIYAARLTLLLWCSDSQSGLYCNGPAIFLKMLKPKFHYDSLNPKLRLSSWAWTLLRIGVSKLWSRLRITNIGLGHYKYQMGNISLDWSPSQYLIINIMYYAGLFDVYLTQAVVICCD